jgi:hypothetical protein
MSTVRASTDAGGRAIALPPARGAWSGELFSALRERSPDSELALEDLEPPADPIADDDLQLALYVAYELHYAGILGVDDAWEWSPALLRFRAAAEQCFERALEALVEEPGAEEVRDVGSGLQQLVAEDDGPPLSRYLESRGTLDQIREHVIHRSAYQLKEADPHSWGIPRLHGPPKVALLEIQFDEYGGGRLDRMHSELFAKTMAGLGLDPAYGAYLARLPGITLATVNLLSGFGLHRRRRGALVGHLAVFEMTSSIPNRRYGNALRRLGLGPDVTDFYDEHVEADAVHESIAAWDLAGALARSEPDVAADVMRGARALLALEARWASHLLDSWAAGRSSLVDPSGVPSGSDQSIRVTGDSAWRT